MMYVGIYLILELNAGGFSFLLRSPDAAWLLAVQRHSPFIFSHTVLILIV